jgi:hypothetical protein
MHWKLPPNIKIYEALGAVSDERIELVAEHEARVYSSTRNKFYTVTYDPEAQAIMANDNGSYWQSYLGYPSIAYLMQIGVIRYERNYAEALKGIAWKDINTKFKNDFDKTAEYIHTLLRDQGVSVEAFLQEVENIQRQIETLNLSLQGKKTKPPSGY